MIVKPPTAKPKSAIAPIFPNSALPGASGANRSVSGIFVSGIVLVVSAILVANGVGSQASAACWQEPSLGDNARSSELTAIPNPTTGKDSEKSDQQLLDDLEHEKYAVREEATRLLTARSARVLPEIAKRYFNAPPETVYRIRKILEGVSASSEEETFLRATSLLLTLYSNGNQAMAERIELLKADWRQRRKSDALKAIVKAGGKVTSAYSSQPILRQALIRQRHAVMQRNAMQRDVGESAGPEELDMDQQRVQVEKILNNSAAENRSFILKHSRPIDVPRQQFINQYTYQQNQPILVQFPDAWVADVKILDRLAEVGSPIALELAGTELTEPHWKTIRENASIVSVNLATVPLPELANRAFPQTLRAITLRGYTLEPAFCKSLTPFSSLGVLRLDNCRLNADGVAELNRLKRVSTFAVNFNDIEVDGKTIAPLVELKRMRAIVLTNTTLKDSALRELPNLLQVNSVKLESMAVSKDFLTALGQMKRLAQLELRGCKFDIEAFQRLESTRRIRISFQPRAFLGVGPKNEVGRPDQLGCQIAFISPGSSAAREGIRVGDVIRAIDGDPVTTFHEVRLRIAQYDPGESMNIKLQRGKEMLELDVELGKNSLVQ